MKRLRTTPLDWATRLGLFLTLSVLLGCFPLPPGDSAVSLDIWNRSDSEFTLGVGFVEAGLCLAVEPDSLGGVYSQTGGMEDAPEVRVYSSDGDLIRTLEPASPHALFVFDTAEAETQYELSYEQGPANVGPVYDLPEVPEIDGQPTPELFPRGPAQCGLTV